MNNDELLIKMKEIFDKKVDEVKLHMGVIAENLESKIQIVAEGQDALNKKVEVLDKKVEILDKKVEVLEKRTENLGRDMSIVKQYVIGVDAKINEHEIILKQVK